MYQLNIGVGWSALRFFFIKRCDSEKTKIYDIVEQHRIILSQRIREYYLNHAAEEDLEDDVMQYLSSVSYSEESSLEIEDYGQDIKTTLTHYFKKINHFEQILIFEGNEWECSKSKCKNQYSIDQAINDKSGPIALYRIPTSFHYSKGASADGFLAWLKNVFKQEKNVNFIDPYLFSEGKISFFLQEYLPRVEPKTVLNIHCPSSCGINRSWNKIISAAKNYNVNIHVYLYYDMHDRYVTTQDRVVSIGAGFDMIDDNITFKKGTSIYVSKKSNSDDDLIKTEKELAGSFDKEYIPDDY